MSEITLFQKVRKMLLALNWNIKYNSNKKIIILPTCDEWECKFEEDAE